MSLRKSWLLACVLAYALEAQQAVTKSELSRSLERNPPDLAILRRVGSDPGYIAVITQAFLKQPNREFKRQLAVDLARRGDPSGEVRAYLRKTAADAIRGAGPDPFLYDADGQSVRGGFSPQFIDWCRQQGISPAEQYSKELSELPDIDLLTLMKDPEAKTIFRLGLAAGPLMAERCARGLALLDSDEDIAAIVARAVTQRDKGARTGLIRALAIYSSPSAKKQIEERLTGQADLLTRYRAAILTDDGIRTIGDFVPKPASTSRK